MLATRWIPTRATCRLRACRKATWNNTYNHAVRSLTTDRKSRDKINYNTELFVNDSKEHLNYTLVTASDLEAGKVPPRRVRMLVRDFIEDSLYNPNYGYFPQQATIFTAPDTSFPFVSIRDTNEFQIAVGKRYAEYGMDKEGPGRQIWHTPTELFKPWYGHAIANSIVSDHLTGRKEDSLVIYEIGAGNGTLAMDILNYIRDRHPQVYGQMSYNIIEISGSLAERQRKYLLKMHPNVDIHHKSIFQWNRKEMEPCYFVAMEVIDNFAHDIIRYDLKTLEPYQGYVAIDDDGDFAMHFTKVTDPLIDSFLNLRQQLAHPIPIPSLLRSSPVARSIYTSLPFAPNLSKPEYIPTRLFNMLHILRTNFPQHRLLLSDFSSLPDTIPGYNSPVVQTRYQNAMVTCSTIFVQQGYFDIFFPTNFAHLQSMYESIRSESSPRSSELIRRGSKIFSHREFLQAFADVQKTRLRSGENPMLDFYKNVKFLF